MERGSRYAQPVETGPDGRGEGRGQTIAAVERAMDVLLLFARSGQAQLGVTEIGRELGMPKAAIHRILASLRGRGLVEFDGTTRRYLLGPATMTLGLRYLARLDVRQLAGPALRELSAATGETATLSLLTGGARVYIDQVTPLREVIMSVPVGVPFPLHAGASSKAFLAFLPQQQAAACLGGELAALTPRTITDPGQLRAELARIRERGWAQSAGERQPGAASVAAPVLDHLGVPAAVISVCGPAERFTAVAPDCARQVLAVTRRLSAAMGYAPDLDPRA